MVRTMFGIGTIRKCVVSVFEVEVDVDVEVKLNLLFVGPGPHTFCYPIHNTSLALVMTFSGIQRDLSPVNCTTISNNGS